MTDEELAIELQRLDQENASLEDQVANAMSAQKTLVSRVVHLQQVTEREEDAIANNLLKKVDQVKREMRSHRQQIRAEEEHHAKLKAQIEDVRHEQEHMENMLEQEQEFVLHKLQRELLETSMRKSEIEKSLAEERRQYLELLHQQLTELSVAQQHATTCSPSASTSGAIMPAGAPGGGGGNTRSSGAHVRTLSDTAASDMNTSFSDAAHPAASNTNSDALYAVGGMSSLTGSVLAGGSFSAALPSGSHTPRRFTTRTPDVVRSRRTIVDLELEINHLLLEQSEYQRKAQLQEQQCTDLLNKLHDIQQLTFLDKARMVRLQEDLVKAKAELENVTQRPLSSSSLLLQRGTPCSSDDPAGSCGNTPLHQLSLRDRTKELLSTPRIDGNGGGAPETRSVPRLRGSSVASDHRSVSPSLASGYNSGVESLRGDIGGVPRLRGNSRVGEHRTGAGRLMHSIPTVVQRSNHTPIPPPQMPSGGGETPSDSHSSHHMLEENGATVV